MEDQGAENVAKSEVVELSKELSVEGAEYQEESTEASAQTPTKNQENLTKIKRRQMTLPLDNMMNSGTSSDTPPTITTTAPDGDALRLNYCESMRKTFKTKRFYESEDDTVWMTQLFSQTIRSTTATPTDDCEISDIVGIVELNSASSSTGARRSINSIKLEDCEIPPTPNVSPTLINNTQQLDPFHLPDIENHSNAEHSSAESQTDNFEMYNEPNLQSLIDNVADEHISITYITDPDILPPDNAASRPNTEDNQNQPHSPHHHQHQQGCLISTPSIVVECYNDDLVKTDEYEVESAHDHYSPPIAKQIPRRPLDGVCFFDTTIEEEEYYDVDVESEGLIGGGCVSNKGTNTELPFDCKNIPPIKEAAGLPTPVAGTSHFTDNDDDDVDDRSESVQTDILDSDENNRTTENGEDGEQSTEGTGNPHRKVFNTLACVSLTYFLC